MPQVLPISQKQIYDVTRKCLVNFLSQNPDMGVNSIDESTRLLGSGSMLDSLGLVTLIVDIEQEIEDQFGISITIANERAMNQTKSPFRSIQTLVEYIELLVKEQTEG